jgi:hypothetical protein
MHRKITLALFTFVLLGGTILGGAHLATAQEEDPAAHPAIGTWMAASEPQDIVTNVRTISLAPGGIASVISTGAGEDPIASLGAWEATSDTSVALTFTMVTNGPAYIVIRASLDFAADGASFTGTYTMEAIFDPAGGGTSGEIGPGTLSGTRLVAEAPGTPGSSFEDFFPAPEATPAP